MNHHFLKSTNQRSIPPKWKEKKEYIYLSNRFPLSISRKNREPTKSLVDLVQGHRRKDSGQIWFAHTEEAPRSMNSKEWKSGHENSHAEESVERTDPPLVLFPDAYLCPDGAEIAGRARVAPFALFDPRTR